MSCTAIISAYSESEGDEREALEVYINVIDALVTPYHLTFASVLKACANLCNQYICKQVYGQAVKLGHASDNCVGNYLISMYSQSGATEAGKALDVLLKKNLVSHTTMVDWVLTNVNVNETFELFRQIEIVELGPNAFTFSTLLSGAASLHWRWRKGGANSQTNYENRIRIKVTNLQLVNFCVFKLWQYESWL